MNRLCDTKCFVAKHRALISYHASSHVGSTEQRRFFNAERGIVDVDDDLPLKVGDLVDIGDERVPILTGRRSKDHGVAEMTGSAQRAKLHTAHQWTARTHRQVDIEALDEREQVVVTPVVGPAAEPNIVKEDLVGAIAAGEQ